MLRGFRKLRGSRTLRGAVHFCTSSQPDKHLNVCVSVSFCVCVLTRVQQLPVPFVASPRISR